MVPVAPRTKTRRGVAPRGDKEDIESEDAFMVIVVGKPEHGTRGDGSVQGMMV
jgi:hypothetical protein